MAFVNLGIETHFPEFRRFFNTGADTQSSKMYLVSNRVYLIVFQKDQKMYA